MIRIAKLSDYAIVLLTYVARESRAWSTTELSATSGLAATTVAKILKMLTRGGLLTSQRGKLGGYLLARSSKRISVADILVVMEGPLYLTECSGKRTDHCALESDCPVRGHWRRINQAVQRSLDGLTLADMAEPLPRRAARPLGGPKLLKLASRR